MAADTTITKCSSEQTFSGLFCCKGSYSFRPPSGSFCTQEGSLCLHLVFFSAHRKLQHFCASLEPRRQTLLLFSKLYFSHTLLPHNLGTDNWHPQDRVDGMLYLGIPISLSLSPCILCAPGKFERTSCQTLETKEKKEFPEPELILVLTALYLKPRRLVTSLPRGPRWTPTHPIPRPCHCLVGCRSVMNFMLSKPNEVGIIFCFCRMGTKSSRR